MAEKMRMDDKQIFGITKLKLQAFSLAALEMILGDIVVKVLVPIGTNPLHERNDIDRLNLYFLL